MAVAGCATTALAASFTFVTPGGSVDAVGDPVSASATFTTDPNAHTLTITLSNLLVNQKDAGQLVSDLFFTLNNVATGLSLDSSSANTIFVNDGGTTTAGSTGVSTGWAFTVNAGVFHLNGLAGAANVPSFEILGPPGPGGVYTNANASIAGNGPHNPFIDQTATFNLSVAGINSDTIITGAVFSFGTTAGDNVPGTPPGTPDSGTTVALLGLSLLGLELVRRSMLKGEAAKV